MQCCLETLGYYCITFYCVTTSHNRFIAESSLKTLQGLYECLRPSQQTRLSYGAKITHLADKKSHQMSIFKTAKSKLDASVYMQCYLVKYFENDNLSSKKHWSNKNLM